MHLLVAAGKGTSHVASRRVVALAPRRCIKLLGKEYRREYVVWRRVGEPINFQPVNHGGYAAVARYNVSRLKCFMTKRGGSSQRAKRGYIH